MKDTTVLFVDDQEEILFLIKRMLKNEAFEVLFATSGKEALDILKNNQIDVIVTDVMMPKMSGLELLDIVKESYPNMVRIILSGFSQIPTLLSAINNGKIFRYITKPWQVDDEAKQIIYDAIEYSKLIKDKDAEINISLNSLCELFAKKGDIIIVTLNHKVFYIHDNLVNLCKLDQILDENLLKQYNYNEYMLSSFIEVYVFKE